MVKPIREDKSATGFNTMHFPPGQQPVFVVDGSSLFGRKKNTKDQLQDLQESLGYKRFVACGECKTSMKIWICFKGSSKSCDSAEDTHTHAACKNDACGTKFKFSGAVQMVTKKDTLHHEQAQSQTATE